MKLLKLHQRRAKRIKISQIIVRPKEREENMEMEAIKLKIFCADAAKNELIAKASKIFHNKCINHNLFAGCIADIR